MNPQIIKIILTWLVFSTEDMKTWTEHPIPLRISDFTWALGDAWASQVIEHNGKFYWLVEVTHSTIPGKAIGVAVSDSPVGPFKDVKGSAIITNDLTSRYTKYQLGRYRPDHYDRQRRTSLSVLGKYPMLLREIKRKHDRHYWSYRCYSQPATIYRGSLDSQI